MPPARKPLLDWNVVILAILTALPPSLIAAATFFQAQGAKTQATETHTAVNSRMSEMITLVKEQATAKAILAEHDKDAQIKAAVDAALARLQTTPPRPKP